MSTATRRWNEIKPPEEHLALILARCAQATQACLEHVDPALWGAGNLAEKLIWHHRRLPFSGADAIFSMLAAELEELLDEDKVIV